MCYVSVLSKSLLIYAITLVMFLPLLCLNTINLNIDGISCCKVQKNEESLLMISRMKLICRT